jgi:HNH endonuclease
VPGRPLPNHDSPELEKLFRSREAVEAARFLLARRNDPPTMAEWIDRSREVFGKTNANTGRRLRDVRDVFVVNTEQSNGTFVYRITGWADKVADPPVSSKLQAEVFNTKGRFCAMCGQTPADGIRLQIDHIVPRSWGGATEIENLEPLCTEHNAGKKAFFKSLSAHSDVIRRAIGLATPWERIGEALKAMSEAKERLPSRLLPVIGGETHEGDPARRLRDLRVVLGWEITAHKERQGKRTLTFYELVLWKPWPPEGPHAAVLAYESARKKRKAGETQ